MVAYAGSAAFSDIVDAPVERLFDFLDDQSNLSSHMSKSSWMMLDPPWTSIWMLRAHAR